MNEKLKLGLAYNVGPANVNCFLYINVKARVQPFHELHRKGKRSSKKLLSTGFYKLMSARTSGRKKANEKVMGLGLIERLFALPRECRFILTFKKKVQIEHLAFWTHSSGKAGDQNRPYKIKKYLSVSTSFLQHLF